jgi:hypothetical protein
MTHATAAGSFAPHEPASTRTARPLRIGLLVDGLRLPAWIRQIIEDIEASGYARIVLVVVKEAPRPRATLARRLWLNRSRLVYLAYRWADERLFRSDHDAFAADDAAALVPDATIMPVRVRETRFCDYVTEDDVARIEAARLDVLLRFGFRILKGPVLGAAKFGVWSYHHGDNQISRGGPAGFWEVMTEQPTTGSMLQILNEELDNGRVIYRSFARTDRSSVSRNRNNYYWKSAAFVTRKLRELAESGPAALDERACACGCRDLRFYSQRLYRKPGNLEALSLVGRYVARRAREHVRRLHEVDQWGLAWSLSNRPVPSTTLYRFTEQWPPLGSSWADPFPVEADGDYHVFLEVYDHATRRGSIGVSRLTGDGVFEAPTTVLDAPYHLSYPFVFRWRGQWFLMPESSNATRIEVFAARHFPFDWTLESVLFNPLRAVDSTLVEIDGRWWLFTSESPHPEVRNYDELYAYYGPTPLGPWTPHRRNPVKSDARSSRGAGRFFWKGRTLFRPSQDASRRYGSAIAISRIDELTPDEFRETLVSRIEPGWRPGLSGTHTLNSCPGLTMVDFRHGRERFARGGGLQSGSNYTLRG